MLPLADDGSADWPGNGPWAARAESISKEPVPAVGSHAKEYVAEADESIIVTPCWSSKGSLTTVKNVETLLGEPAITPTPSVHWVMFRGSPAFTAETAIIVTTATVRVAPGRRI